MVKKIFISALIVLVVIQVFSIDKTNPTSDPVNDLFSDQNISQDIQLLIKNTCADCHSNNSTYPWYTNIEPISWWIKGHIKNGRKKLNFSNWNSFDNKKKNHLKHECVEVLEEKRMPLTLYALGHPKARLSDSQRKSLIEFFENL